MSGLLAGKSILNNLILILSFRHDFKRKVRGTEEAAPVTMSQKCPYVDSYVTPPHCDGRAGECGLWSQTAKPKSETCRLLMAFAASASLPVEIRVAFPHGMILRIR